MTLYAPEGQWKNTDPRHDIGKYGAIIILRPRGSGCFEAGCGFVDTKNGWSIRTDFENHPVVSAHDKWDPIWFWTFAPERK